jgi:hypothetical protein
MKLAALEARRAEPRVAFSVKKNKLVDAEGKSYRGITKLLGKTFYPDYAYTLAGGSFPVKGVAASGGSGGHRFKKPRPTTSSKPSLADAQERGLRKGTAVDNELRGAALVINAQGLTVSQYLAFTKRAPGKPHRVTLHPHTRRILQGLVAYGWHLVACQLPVSSGGTRIATLVDMLCFDTTTKRMVVVEVKTGFRNYYHRGNAAMKAPFQAKSNAPYSQHQLQLALTKFLFMRTFRYADVHVDAAVLRVDEAGLTRYVLEGWAVTTAATAAIVALLRV